MEEEAKTDQEKLQEKKYNRLRNSAFYALGIGCVVLLVALIMVLINYRLSFQNYDHEATLTVGVFIGGVVPVFISIATVLLVYITFTSNRQEFKAINKANKKLIEANNLQQFNTTFDNMCNHLEKIVIDYNTKGYFEKSVKTVYNDLTYEKHEYFTHVEGNEDIKVLDNIISRRLHSLKNLEFETDMYIFNSAIILLFQYFEKNIKSNQLLELNQELYISRIKYHLSEKYVMRTILFQGIDNEKLKLFINNYSLLWNIEPNFDFDCELPHERFDKFDSEFKPDWFIYRYPFQKIYNRSALKAYTKEY